MSAPPSDTVHRRATWFARRARNAARRPILIGMVGLVGFLATLLALAIVPRQRQAEARLIASLLTQRADTAPLVARREEARAALAIAEAELADARQRAIRRPPRPFVDTLPAASIARRDSIARGDAALTTMIERVENAPLPATFRALAEMPELAGEPRVAALRDTLATIERAREAFGTAGGVNPLFVALTARATSIGREIQLIAERRRSEGRAELERLRPERRPPPPVIPLVDTMPFRRRHAEVTIGLDSTLGRLSALRASNDDIERRVLAARAAANIVIPPLAMLAAALIVGAGTGYGAALVLELRRARVADGDEIEATTGARVLAVIGPRPPRQSDRFRRRVDHQLSPLVDPGSDAYRMVYLHLAASAPRATLVTVTGDDPRVNATVAVNVATAASYDARTTLLVDGQVTADLVASLLQVRGAPGLAGILAGDIDWTEAIVSATVGRDRTLDVIPGGAAPDGTPSLDLAPVGENLARMARRYDLVLVVEPPGRIAARPGRPFSAPDVVVCTVAGVTPVSAMIADMSAMRQAGVKVQGIVLWDGPMPEIDERPFHGGQAWDMPSLSLSGGRHGR